MKIALLASSRVKYLPEELRALHSALHEGGIEYCVNRPFAEVLRAAAGIDTPAECIYDLEPPCQGLDMMVCYGGDGTFLEGVRRGHTCSLPILGINSGRLGFLSHLPKEELAYAFARIAAGRYTIEERTTLHVGGDALPADARDSFAFNEMTIHRGMGPMIAVEVFVNGQMVGRYWGDGVILSTPSGSTAYSLSVGGPIIAPECRCFVISPIAPHNLSMRPVVIPDSAVVDFRIASRGESVAVTLDNRKFDATGVCSLQAQRGDHNVRLVRLNDVSFYDTLRNKMLWGLDRREEG